MDLVMLTLLNAQERSATEFCKLFATASPGYKFLGVTRPEGCRMSIIEAVWEGEDCDMPTPADTPLVTPSDSPIEGKGEGDKTLPLPIVKVEEKVEETETMEAKGTTEKLMSLNHETLTASVPRITPEGLLETETMDEKGATEKVLEWKGEILTTKVDDTAKSVGEEVEVGGEVKAADPLA